MGDDFPVTSTTGTEAGSPPRATAAADDGAAAFDSDHPPSADLVGECVHCGFCLPSCPTYVLWGEEMDSPRGRIYLMGQGLEGEPMTPAMVQHFDRCLGCLACVTACPSGVQYDRLIEATRAQVERRYRRGTGERWLRAAIFAVFPYRRRLRMLRGPLRAYQASRLPAFLRRHRMLDRMPATAAAMESLTPVLGRSERVARRTPASGARRGTVGMLLGCVQREFFPAVNAATARVLAAEGFDVLAPGRQGCCGALSEHNGRAAEARRFARRLIDSFPTGSVDWVVVNSAGCGSTMKEYARLLADDPSYRARAEEFAGKVRDVAEFLAEQGTVAPRAPLPVTVAYHDACHLAHGQRVRAQPRQLLTEIPGVQVREVADGEICCGSAGIYNLLHPEPARELGDRKAANVRATGADLLVTANPGCLMQISAALKRAGQRMPMAHTVQVLDASIRGLPPAEIGGSAAGERRSRQKPGR